MVAAEVFLSGDRPAPLVSLRTYQRKTVDSVISFYEKACGRAGVAVGFVPDEIPELAFARPCVSLPTGGGKTVVCFWLAQMVAERWGWRTLVLVPDKDLVAQHVKGGRKDFPGLRIGSWKEAKGRLADYDVVVATVASLGRKVRGQIPRNYFALTIWDEAHFVPARTFTDLFKYLSGARIGLGVSATIVRGDGRCIAHKDHFTNLVSFYTLNQLSEAGYLVPITGVFVPTDTSLAGVKQTRSDYDKAELSRTVNNSARNELAVDAWLKHAGGDCEGRGRPTIAYAVSVDHARDVAECFERRGVRAGVVWGSMGDDEYDQVIGLFREGIIRVVVNVKKLVQGTDLPFVSCVLILRPATPAGMAVLGPQMVGRGVRLSPATGKKNLLVIELLDRDRIKVMERDVAAARVQGRGARGSAGGGRRFVPKSMVQAAVGAECSLDDPEVPLHLQARRHRDQESWAERVGAIEEEKKRGGGDFFFDVVARINQSQRFVWIPLGSSSDFMILGRGDFIEVCAHHDLLYELRVVHGGRLVLKEEFAERGPALSAAHRWLRANVLSDAGAGAEVGNADEEWRRAPASVSPLHCGRAHEATGLPYEVIGAMKLGEVCDLIATVVALEDRSLVGDQGTAAADGSPALWGDPPVQGSFAFI